MEKLAAAARGESLQLRLACIHPQLTRSWQQLSGDLQLQIGGTLSMEVGGGRLAACSYSASETTLSSGLVGSTMHIDYCIVEDYLEAANHCVTHLRPTPCPGLQDIMERLVDKVQFEVQDAERMLCANLNTLALVHILAAAPRESGSQDAATVEGPVADNSQSNPLKRPRQRKYDRADAVAEAVRLLEQSYRQVQ